MAERGQLDDQGFYVASEETVLDLGIRSWYDGYR